MKKNFSMKVEIELIITQQDIDDIMCAALEGGINYWCSEAEVVGDYLGEYASEQISRGGALKLHDAEEDEVYELTLEKFLSGVKQFIAAGNTMCLEFSAYNYIDACNIDAGDADSIIQYALFDDVVYG